MMVTFISQCEKNALKKTRRVLDAFADRIGDNAWQTIITEEGLNTVKKMLRQTASKSARHCCAASHGIKTAGTMKARLARRLRTVFDNPMMRKPDSSCLPKRLLELDCCIVRPDPICF